MARLFVVEYKLVVIDAHISAQKREKGVKKTWQFIDIRYSFFYPPKVGILTKMHRNGVRMLQKDKSKISYAHDVWLSNRAVSYASGLSRTLESTISYCIM